MARQGHALLETVLAVAVLAVLAGAAFQAVAMADRTSARLAAYLLAAAVREVQEQAVARGETCWLRLEVPADQAVRPARHTARCLPGVGFWQRWAELDRGVRVEPYYYRPAGQPPIDPDAACPPGQVNVDGECHEPVPLPAAGGPEPGGVLEIGFAPSGLRDPDPRRGEQVVLILRDRRGDGEWPVRVRSVTGEVTVCTGREPIGSKIRIQCG